MTENLPATVGTDADAEREEPAQAPAQATESTELAQAVEVELPPLGIHPGIPNAQYHRGPGISKSGLDRIDRSPEHYITEKQHPRPDTEATGVGAAFHCLVLEPDAFPKEVAVLPPTVPNRPSQRQRNAKKMSQATLDAIAFWDNWDKENAGKTILTNRPGKDPFWQPGNYDRIQRMRDSLMAHPIASILLDPGQGLRENSCYWLDPDTNRLCKCRPDFLNQAHNLCVDLKTTEDASYTEFGRSAGKYRYYVQDPWYTDGLKHCGVRVRGFVLVAVEKDPPFGIGCYIVTPEGQRIGREQARRNLETYDRCMAENDWPGYPPEVRDLEVPRWGLMAKIS